MASENPGTSEARRSVGGRTAPRREEAPCYAALDLGTNNCRLLIASPTHGGFRVVESFSRIVRLGDGLSRTGRLDDAAMDRALAALDICAEKLARRRPKKLRAVATQACRIAENGREFVERVAQRTGIQLTIIAPQEEARLAVAGCLNLLDRSMEAALVVDVGGGSTELSWVDLKASKPGKASIAAWLSIPAGVVTLAERFPEQSGTGWFEDMVRYVRGEIEAFSRADALKPVFHAGGGHLIGTSGAITSLAGMHLRLPRYDRSKVDGLWLTCADCDAAAERLVGMGVEGRAAEPCIGPERADLVLAGAAILRAVQDVWPCERVRVADRGLREGILLSLMSEAGGGAKRRRRRRRSGAAGSPSSRAAAE